MNVEILKCSISNLQNGIFLLILKMCKIQNMYSVGCVILNTSCEFCYDNFVIVTTVSVKRVLRVFYRQNLGQDAQKVKAVRQRTHIISFMTHKFELPCVRFARCCPMHDDRRRISFCR